MRNVARLLVVTLFVILLGTITVEAQVSIGINLSTFPRLVIVPGYPVYYAPSVRSTTSSTTAYTGSSTWKMDTGIQALVQRPVGFR
jgi:hypothetical protein